MDRAARIAIREVRSFLVGNPQIDKVLLVCFGEEAVPFINRRWPRREAFQPSDILTSN